jgi:hypothetical protein
MASFTDTTIPKFNPYIQQLPVEAMVSVGMDKQRRYDAGYQRIQSQIDQVAGMSVLRPVDKQYMQSKLNELGNNLKGVAAADFSNFQLVNSVGGMVGQIAKDRYIQNAVSSTAKIRKEQSLIEEYRKKGKSDKNNEDYFNEKILRPYLEAGLTDKEGNPVQFNGSYTPYVDIMGMIREEAKAAGIDTTILQKMYETDSNGNIEIDKKTGKPKPARTMTEMETSTNAKQIAAVVENVLSRGDVQGQLEIDGWSNTRFTPASSILGVYNKQYEKNINEVDEEMLQLNTLLTGKMDDNQKKEVTQKLDEYKKLKDKYKSQYNSLMSLAQGNPEAFKQNYYKTNYENNLLEQFTKRDQKIKNLESPLVKQLNWEATYAFNEKKEAFDQSMAIKNYNLNLRKQNVDELKFEAEYEIDSSTGKYRKKPTPGEEGGDENYRLTADVPGEESRSATQRTENQVFTIQKNNERVGTDLMYTYLYKLNDGKNKEGQPLTKSDVVKTINAWAKGNNESTDQFLTRWMLNFKNKAKEAGVKLSTADNEMLGDFKANYENYTTLIATTKVAEQQALKQTGVDLQEYLKPLKPINVKLQDGRDVVITKEDILDYMLLIKNNDKGAEARIISKYGSLKDFPLNTYKDFQYRRNYNVPEEQLTAIEKESLYRSNLQEQSGMFNIYTKDFNKLKEVSKIKNEFLAGNVHTDDMFSFSPVDAKSMAAAKNKVNALLSSNTAISGANYDQATALAALQEEGSKVSFKANAPFEEGGEWTGSVKITDKDGNVIEAIIPVQKDLEQITGKKFNPYTIDALTIRAKASPFKSTNLGAYTTDKNAWETAAIDSEQFVSLKGSKKYIPLGADLNIVKGGYTVTGYFKNAETGELLEPIEFDGLYKSTQKAKGDLSFLNESMIDKKLR